MFCLSRNDNKNKSKIGDINEEVIEVGVPEQIKVNSKNHV